MARGQHGQCRQLYLSLSRHSPTSLSHEIILMKMLYTPSRGWSSCFTTGRAPISTKKSNVQLIQTTIYATYEGKHIWDQSLDFTLPSPTHWGWISDMYKPLCLTLPEASKVCQELFFYGKCQRGYIKKCKKASLKCTLLCACDWECSQNRSCKLKLKIPTVPDRYCKKVNLSAYCL